jgi:hypothetical protein
VHVLQGKQECLFSSESVTGGPHGIKAWGSGAGGGADGHETPTVVGDSELRVDPMVCGRPHLSPPSTSVMTTRSAAGGLMSRSENHHCLVPP